MARYTGWRRLVGDTDRPDLLDLGKRLLGYLEQRRANGAPKSLVIQRQAPDGSIVRARFVYDLPIIEVQAATPGQQEQVDLAGFVLSPTDDYLRDSVNLYDNPGSWPDQGDVPEVVAATEPAKRNLGFSGYSRLFPSGFHPQGNIDWRNDDETVVLSFYGPRARYFEQKWETVDTFTGGARGAFRPWVFRNGYRVLDLSDTAVTDVLPALSGCRIVGAAIRGGRLVFVARDSGNTTESVCDVALTANPAAGNAVAVPSTLRLLGSRAMLPGEDYGEASHPWMFSPGGSEARCIRFSPTPPGQDPQRVMEGVLAFALDGAATFTMTQIAAAPLRTSTTTTSGTGTTAKQVYWLGHRVADSTGTPLPDAAWGSTGTYTDVTVDETRYDAEKLPCAVDYRGGAPVYLYALLPSSQQTTTVTRSPVFSADSTNYDSSDTSTTSIVKTGYAAGFEFDGFTVHPTIGQNTSSTRAGSLSLQHATGFTLGTYDYTSGAYSNSYSGTQSENSYAATLTYADLRRGLLVYEETHAAITTTQSASVTQTLTNETDDYNAGHTFVESNEQTGSHTATTYVVLNGAVIFSDSVSSPVSSSSPVTRQVMKDYNNYVYYDYASGNTQFSMVDFTNFQGADGAQGPQLSVSSATTGYPSHLLDWFVDTLHGNALNNAGRSLRVDRNGFVLNGSWQFYKRDWAFSMGLPRSAYEGVQIVQQDRWGSGSSLGNLEVLCTGRVEKWSAGVFDHVVDPPFDLFFPIGVMTPTRTP